MLELLKAVMPASSSGDKSYKERFQGSSTLPCFLNPEYKTMPAQEVWTEANAFSWGMEELEQVLPRLRKVLTGESNYTG